MKLIYLYHSGFALLGEGYTIIFDYFEDSASPSSGIASYIMNCCSVPADYMYFPVTVMRIILIKRY